LKPIKEPILSKLKARQKNWAALIVAIF